MSHRQEDELLTVAELASWLKLSAQQIHVMNKKKTGPKRTDISPRRVRYRRGDVLEWLSANTHGSTSEY